MRYIRIFTMAVTKETGRPCARAKLLEKKKNQRHLNSGERSLGEIQVFSFIIFLLERYSLPATLKACTALKNDLRIDHLYTAKGSAPERKKIKEKNERTVARLLAKQ